MKKCQISESKQAIETKMDPKILAAAAKHFEKFYESEVFADILDNFASVCELLKVQPGNFVNFYPELKVRR